MKVTQIKNCVVEDSIINFSLLDFNLNVNYVLKQIKPEGKIVYEYNPLRNFRYTEESKDIPEGYEKGMLGDFITDRLKFDFNHPVDIVCQPSYDGSVNLILNDDKNPPRLINSRFTVLENNTYKIIDRKGNNDTNIYDDSSEFEIDTSLYKRVTTIPKVEFTGIGYGGNLKVGNYVFYFRYVDSDGNETDFVEESGIVTCHVGNINDPFSIRGGISDENSYKTVSFTVSNIDPSYEQMIVYYTRSTSDENGIESTTAFRVDKKFSIKNDLCKILITGNETMQQVTLEDINVRYFIASSAKAQDKCQNMLFMGNVYKPEIPYEDLSDISLRFYPYTKKSSVDLSNEDYNFQGGEYSGEYYNAKNIYYNLGYWNKEMYRLGIVYILSNNTLSPVFNIRGTDKMPDNNFDIFRYLDEPLIDESTGNRKKISIDEGTYLIESSVSTLENSKGVIKIDHTQENPFEAIGIGICVRYEILNYLRETLDIKGFFFVRQKRVPTILCQALTIGLDKIGNLPVIPTGEKEYMAESFLSVQGRLVNEFASRKYILSSSDVTVSAAIAPEFEQRQPFFNNIFTGTEFTVKESSNRPSMHFLTSGGGERDYCVDSYRTINNDEVKKCIITAVGDNVQLISDGKQNYRSRAGEAEEAYKYEYIKEEVNKKFGSTGSNNLVRGAFGPYLGMRDFNGNPNTIVDIYIPGYSEAGIPEYFYSRFTDASPYYAISERFDLEDYVYKDDRGEKDIIDITTCYRGDCFICNYTHRMNRNFQDPEAPTNDEIVDANTWKDNYTKGDSEKNGKINRGDVNAIQLGHWVTFKVCSSINLSMRNTDTSFVSESGLVGHPRTFYPLYSMSVEGNNKIPESFITNMGESSTTSDRWNYEVPDVPYIKNEFDTRILYSDIAVNDAFKNGFRVFQLTHYRDYPKTYGGLMKLVELFGNLLCVFEHGVALIPVNERLVAGEGSGGNAFINTSNVLPENPKMLSDMFGSQWAESVIKTPYFVYGVDTVGKKIWRTNGSQFEIISDFKIQSFLNDNISLTERELTPIIGVRNVKTHYNAYKGDVMFTFYDNLYGFEEKVWNICYNEVLQKWVTFYSWVPSYSENIDNIFFSFNRNTSKWISKLGMSKADSTNADGIVLSNNVIKGVGLVGTLTLVNRAVPDTDKTQVPSVHYVYSLEKDNFGNWKYFSIVPKGDSTVGDGNFELFYNGDEDLTDEENIKLLNSKPTWMLDIKVSLEIDDYSGSDTSIKQYINGWTDYQTVNYGYYQNSVAVVGEKVLNNPVKNDEGERLINLTTDFWKHGKAGIIDIQDKILPTKWYGDQHPFEFEFVVAVNPTTQKLFNNLQIISNKAAPDSFHYEIVGECYSFSNDKPNMYYRQEATKELYQNLGSDILFNRNYTDIEAKRNPKSTIFPLYYARQDTFNEIEDKYVQMTDPTHSRDYRNLSGSEIVYDERLQEFRILTHIKGSDFDKVGRLRGNMNYQEDKWLVQIPSLTFMQKNETWEKTPPLVLNWLPDDLTKTEVTAEDLPNTFDMGMLDVSKWTYRQEARLRDKYLKVKIRYTGEEKAIIVAIKTLFTLSYA